ncbi:MAG TPA: hypothetical protein PKI93_00965 [Alphaproteobacteria bacterium]|nr:hypothetical protein [Alphaproteobacteria bacterium]HNS44908.1 hypothetical protein [Alphaproteobacteria bacterium]
MTRFLTILVFIFILSAPLRGAWAETAYLGNIPDIPMMAGMEEVPDEGFVFDAPDGQIVRAVVFAPKKAENDVLGYYTKVLPELGWVARKTGLFIRNGEQLTVTIGKVDGGVLATFDLSPRTD